MREIKFRAVMQRHHDLKYFVTDGYTIDTGLSLLFGFENDRLDEFKDMVMNSEKFFKTIGTKWWEEDWCHVDLGQFTGLTDKNGVEIYEGDIVTWNEYGQIYTIIFKDASFALGYLHEAEEPVYLHSTHTSLCEVIGNIHEHPRLLEVLDDNK